MPQPPLVVEATRNGIVESTHLVDVAVVSTDGTVVASAGEPHRLAAFRSSVKPIQAAVSAAVGWTTQSSRHRALACSSHNGEPEHVLVACEILEAAGLDASRLGCPPAWPYRASDIAHAGEKRRVQHNCSGKHAAFLAACAAAGFPLESYLAPDHPLQQRILERITDLAGARPEALLTDGCGAPTPVLPLAAMARAFLATLETPEHDAMLAHPFLVGGTERLDTAVLEAGVLTKAGAEGLSCAAGRVQIEHGPVAIGTPLGVAVKARDGSIRGRTPALLGVLAALGLLDAEAVPEAIAHPPTLGGGRHVGRAELQRPFAVE